MKGRGGQCCSQSWAVGAPVQALQLMALLWASSSCTPPPQDRVSAGPEGHAHPEPAPVPRVHALGPWTPEFPAPVCGASSQGRVGLFLVPSSRGGTAWLVGEVALCKGAGMAELGHLGWVAHIRSHEEKEVKRKGGWEPGAAICILIPGLADMRGRFGGRARRMGGPAGLSHGCVPQGPARVSLKSLSGGWVDGWVMEGRRTVHARERLLSDPPRGVVAALAVRLWLLLRGLSLFSSKPLDRLAPTSVPLHEHPSPSLDPALTSQIGRTQADHVLPPESSTSLLGGSGSPLGVHLARDHDSGMPNTETPGGRIKSRDHTILEHR